MNQRNSPDYAVRFGETVDAAMGDHNRAFPFIYSLVQREDDTWEQNKGIDVMDSIGPRILAGGQVDHAIKLDPDYMYKLLWAKFCAYYNAQGTYLWYEPVLAGGNMLLEYDYQTVIGTPLVASLRISISMHGPDGRYLYGGKNLDNMVNQQGDLSPVDPGAIQGYEYGWGQLRTPYLLPREGLIRLQITNTHSVKALYVGGLLYGLKVRI